MEALREFTSFGYLNGRAWQSLAPDTRFLFIYVINESFTRAEQKEKQFQYIPESLSFGETMESLNRFYAEPENRLIPIMDALHIASDKAKGVAQPEIDRQIAGQRRLAIEAPERK